MPLDPQFWEIEDTPLLHQRVPGRLHIDVILNRQDNWPRIWTPKAIWADPGLSEMEVGYIDTQNQPNNQASLRKLIDVTARWTNSGPDGHRVDGRRGTYTLSRDKAVTRLQYRLCKRTVVDADALTWILAHWNPDRAYPLADWWVARRDDCEHYGLHADDIAMMDEAVSRAPGLKTPWLPVVGIDDEEHHPTA